MALLGTAPGAARTDPAAKVEYGPAPNWVRYKELGESAIRAMLLDPESARFTWTYGYRRDGFQPFATHKRYGYATCGYVNAKNRMGGYTGQTAFVVVIDYDRVVYAEIGKPSGSDMLSEACDEAAAAGKFPEVSTMPSAQPSTSIVGLGLAIETHPKGILVSSVTPGGVAALSGIKQGAVLSRFNGIALSGMGADVLQRLVEAAVGERVFTDLDGQTIRIQAIAVK